MIGSERSAVAADVADTRLQRVLALWGRRRLRLVDLAPIDRVVAAAALMVSYGISALILWVGVAGHAPGGNVEIPLYGRSFLPARVPTLAAFAGLVGAGIAVVALARAATFRSVGVRIPLILTLGFVGASAAALVVGAGRAERGLAAQLDKAGLESLATLRPGILNALGWGAAICAVGFVTIALARPSWRWSAVLAGAPFVLSLVAFIMARRTIAPSAATVANPAVLSAYRDAMEFDGRGYVTASLSTIVAQMGVLPAILGFWGAIVYARMARDLSIRAVRAVRVTGVALAVALGIKLAWLSAGLAGSLPVALGGRGEAWTASAHNGLAAWIVAAVIATAGVAFLARRAWPQVEEGGFMRAGWIVTAAWQWLGLVFGGMLLAFAIADGLLPGGWGRGTISDALSWLLNTDLLLQAQAVAVVLAAPAGLLLLRREHWRSVGTFLVAIGVWSMPRALNVLFAPDSPHYFGAPRALTLDVAVTIAASVLLVLWFMRKQTAVPPTVIAFVVVAFTIVADTRIVASAWSDGITQVVFYLSLAAPVLIRFALDAEDLNVLDADRTRQVLTATGLFAAVMAAVAFQLLIGTIQPGLPSDADVARLVFLPAFLAVLLANSVVQHRLADDAAGVL